MNHVVITNHALEQYCTRVNPIERDELQELLTQQLSRIERRKGDFIRLDGVWWIMVEPHTFITCYGRSHLDLPKAIGWAARMNDRISLEWVEKQKGSDNVKSERDYCKYCGEGAEHNEIIALGVCRKWEGKETETIYICEEHYEEHYGS